jgi:serine/threonine protein kinase
MGNLDISLEKRAEEERAKHHVEPGMYLKEYLLQGKIGEGAVANIFSAINTFTKERVSIKAVKADIYVSSRREEHLARFKREVGILSDYHHPNLVDVKYYAEDKTLFYVMDYIEGKDLFEVIDDYRRMKKFIEPRRAIAMAVTIACVLEGLHAKGTYHRDLRSENVMVEYPGTKRERFILIDLGFGKITHQDPGLTGKYDILGTVEFMPPEQLKGKPFDARSDIYSLSTILYEMLCLRTPFVKRYRKKDGTPIEFEEFTDFEQAKRYIQEKEVPIVIKTDDLADGAGIFAVTDENAINLAKGCLERSSKVVMGIGEKETIYDLAIRKREEEVPPIAKINPHLHPEITRIVMKGLEKDPDKRSQNCKEFIDALEEAARYAA